LWVGTLENFPYWLSTKHKIILLYICVLDCCTVKMLFIIWWPYLPPIRNRNSGFKRTHCEWFHATFHTYWKQRTLVGRQGNTKKIPWLNNSKKQRDTPNSKSQYIPERSTTVTKGISTPSPSYLQESHPKKKTCQNLTISIWVTLQNHIFLMKWDAQLDPNLYHGPLYIHI
jgi:hypothetical protein